MLHSSNEWADCHGAEIFFSVIYFGAKVSDYKTHPSCTANWLKGKLFELKVIVVKAWGLSDCENY